MLSSRSTQLPTDGVYFPAKTPSRGLKNRTENAHAMGGGVAMTTNAKGGKHAILAPKTPFQPASAQPHRFGKDQKIILTTKRALGDKTPLPNRFGNNVYLQTPLAGLSKMNKLTQEAGRGAEGGGTPDSVQRPSSLRKHIKHPRNSGKFETPANKGNHWDISDGDIDVLETQPEVEEPNLADLDELEYGPPNTLDLPYEPPFDFALPDYKEVGKTLRRLAFSVYHDEIPIPTEPDMSASELEITHWNMMILPELESDDPFHLARKESEAAKNITVARTVPSIRGLRPLAGKATVNVAKTGMTRPISSGQRAPSVASARSVPSQTKSTTNPTTNARAGSSLANRANAMRPVVSTFPKTVKSTPSLKNMVPSTGTAAFGARVTARPQPTQRPHTSTALVSSNRARTGASSSAGIRTVKTAVPALSRDEIFISLDADSVDDFDFKFDI